ncbi:MAG: hypothetical protein KDK55_06765 [Chlamydiia bacterium]|nr:hypothetical protein [Chlamydiia bacterium]
MTFDFKKLPRCGAKARSNGYQPCRQAAMQNGRCYFHGGKSPVKHGFYTKQAMQERRDLKEFCYRIRYEE